MCIWQGVVATRAGWIAPKSSGLQSQGLWLFNRWQIVASEWVVNSIGSLHTSLHNSLATKHMRDKNKSQQEPPGRLSKEAEKQTRDQTRLQMADIARLAGVSTSTVSRALNNSPLVNLETRQRVAELARSLNYQINIGAKNLRLGQNKTVAVVVPFATANRQNVSDPFFISMLGALADRLTEAGYDLLLSRIDADHLDAAASLYSSGRAIGVILIGQWQHHDQLNELARQRVPMVVWGAQLPQQLYCTVGSDNVEGGFLATSHLIGRGRRHIAFFGDRELPEVAQRFTGYRQALKKSSIEFREALCVDTPFTPDGGGKAITTLLQRKIQFDALFACSDLIAMTSINTLRSEGIHVPHDVAIIGYDDIELAAHFHPPLSTVHQQIDVAGGALVNALMAMLRGEPSPPVLLPTQLIVRATSE
jgi:DNA-binding LacI/PurR family transcriptional regulator